VDQALLAPAVESQPDTVRKAVGGRSALGIGEPRRGARIGVVAHSLRAFPDGLVELVADDILDDLRRSSEVCCSDAPSDKETPRGGRALGQSR